MKKTGLRDTARSVPVLCVLFSLTFGLLLNFLVPRFQSPDEPQHFIAVMGFALGPEKRPEVMSEILRIMARTTGGHFRHGTAEVFPKDFSKEEFLTF